MRGGFIHDQLGSEVPDWILRTNFHAEMKKLRYVSYLGVANSSRLSFLVAKGKKDVRVGLAPKSVLLEVP